MKKCKTKYCKNDPEGRKFCNTCRSRASRIRNPEKYCYNNLKNNAKRRGKEFDLSYSQFLQFCLATKYIQGKGKSKTSFSIDRIDNWQGYTVSNIRVITLAENSSKGAKTLVYDWQNKYATVISNLPNPQGNTNPENYF